MTATLMDSFLPRLLLVFRQSGLLLVSLMPFILLSAAAGALLKKIPPGGMHRRLSRLKPAAAIPAAALLGALSPLCTLGSVPVVAGLTGMGLPLSAGLAFLAASSVITPQMLLIAVGTVGLKLTVFQLAGGLLLGMATGWAAELLKRKQPVLMRQEQPEASESGGWSCKPFLTGFVNQLEFVLFYLLLGVVASQAIGIFLPAEWMNLPGGGRSLAAVAAGALLAGPLYVCGGAVLPVLGGLRDNGLSDGVILAFLICGPATRLRSFAALSKFLKPGGLALYILFIFVFSVLFGFFSGQLSGLMEVLDFKNPVDQLGTVLNIHFKVEAVNPFFNAAE
jgi:uncharacterized membrane protein YraQ (UPF0718 family)